MGLRKVNNMARSTVPSQQKLAEKLLILNDRGLGMLTRIYNIKKVNIVTFKLLLNKKKSSL